MRKTPLFAVICSVFLLGTAPTAKANELDFNLAQSGPAIAAVKNQSFAQLSSHQPAPPLGQPSLAQSVLEPSVSEPDAAITAFPSSNAVPEHAQPTIDGLAESTPLPQSANLLASEAARQSVPEAAAAIAMATPPPEVVKPVNPASEQNGVLNFDLQTAAKVATPSQPAPFSPDAQPDQVTPQKSTGPIVALATQPLPKNPDVLFAGGAESIVARTVGHAEGTRTADGQKTSAYYGHLDPGNAHWNLGSFSYQHCDRACTPETADDRQLARLRRQTAVIQQRAIANNLTLTLEEALNGIDLANQAPLAALAQGGYIDWLKAAREKGLTGSDAVLWARTWSFLNPRTRTWDAPGLGNQYESISYDQDRRLSAIAQALAKYPAYP